VAGSRHGSWLRIKDFGDAVSPSNVREHCECLGVDIALYRETPLFVTGINDRKASLSAI
jgi:hypothetical protein